MKYLKIDFAVVFTYLQYLVGGFDLSLYTLCLFVILDFITGLSKAFYNKDLSSKACREGIIKKSMIIVVLIMAVALDNLLGTDVVRNVVSYFFIANEGISILENLAIMGVSIPDKIKEVLEQLKDS